MVSGSLPIFQSHGIPIATMGRPEVLPPHTSQAKQEKPSLKLPGVGLGGGVGGQGKRCGAADW